MIEPEKRRIYWEATCDQGHDLLSGNGCVVSEDEEHVMRLCRTCRGVNNRSYGSEWSNERGQVFVFVPDHPNSRKDGFYPRARLVVEEREGRLLNPDERVLHYPDEKPDADTPDNLMLFESQSALAQFRSKLYQDKKEKLGGGWAALTPKQRAYQEQMARERELDRELKAADEARERSIAALKAANEKRRKK